MSALPRLQRPRVAHVAFDPKWNTTPEGWPTEAVKAGSVEALVAYACYYASRQARPDLVPPGAKAPIDPDFCDLFWRSCSALATVEDISTELVKAAARAGGDRALLYQLCDGLCVGLDVRNDHLGYLRPDAQATLLSAGKAVYYMLSALHPLLPEEQGALRTLFAVLFDAELFVDATASRGLAVGGMRRTAVGIQRALAELTTAIRGGGSSEVLATGAELTPLGILASSAPVYIPGAPLNSSPPFALLIGSGVQPGALAEAWALLDEALFCAIPPREWLACGWDKPRFEHAADGVRSFVDKYNACSLWVSASVISAGPGPEHRAATIARLVQVANHLRRLNDFSGVSSIVMGLKREGVSRLLCTWSLVPPAVSSRLAALTKEVEDKEQYRKYKDILKGVPKEHPAVPHLGAHTMEMTAAEMNLPESVDLWRGGPGGASMKRPRELWRMAGPLVALQHPDRGYVASGAIASIDLPLLSALSRSLAPFVIQHDDERNGAVERLDAHSRALQGEAQPLQPAQRKGIVDALIGEAQREKVGAEAAGRAAAAAAAARASQAGADGPSTQHAPPTPARPVTASVEGGGEEEDGEYGDEEGYDEEGEEYEEEEEEGGYAPAEPQRAPQPARGAYAIAGRQR